MELVRMPLDELRANPMNFRTEFEGIEELADRLELTPGRPGEPLYPLVAVRDANVARIVDGERRYRAMMSRGKAAECYVFLCDDMDEADQAVAILAANDRQNLSEENVAAGYQQALILGVPEEHIDKMAGRKGAGTTLKRAIRRGGGKPVQESLDRLIAADEFSDSDEDYAAVMEAENWDWKANEIRNRRKAEAEAAELELALAEVADGFGLAVLDKKPKGAEVFRSIYRLDAETVRSEGPTWAAAGKVLVRPKERYYSWEVCSAARDVDDAEKERTERRNRVRRMRSAGEKRRAEWIYGKLCDSAGRIHGMFGVERIVGDYYEEYCYGNAERLAKLAGEDPEDCAVPLVVNAWMVADAWHAVDHMDNDGCDAVATGSGYDRSWRQVEAHIALMEAVCRDGYEPEEGESELLAMCKAALAAHEARGASDDDEDGGDE